MKVKEEEKRMVYIIRKFRGMLFDINDENQL